MIKYDNGTLEVKGFKAIIMFEITEIIRSLKEKGLIDELDIDFIYECAKGKEKHFDLDHEDPEILREACAMAAAQVAMSGDPELMKEMSRQIDEINKKLKERENAANNNNTSV